MGIRKRIAYVYPGNNKSGIGLVLLDDDTVTAMAVGSVDKSVVLNIMDRFSPKQLVVSSDKTHRDYGLQVPVPAYIKKLRFSRGGWFDRKVPFPDREHRSRGALVLNTWKMMYDDLFRQHRTKIRDWRLDDVSDEWLARYSPKRVKNER